MKDNITNANNDTLANWQLMTNYHK